MKRQRRKPVQMSLSARGERGGGGGGAGRKRLPEGAHKGHRPRPALASRHPVHVTLKVLPNVPYLRKADCWNALRKAFVAGKRTELGFRLVHFSVQGNHMHLICEAKDQVTL